MPLITKDVASEGFNEVTAADFIDVDSLAANTQNGGLHVDVDVDRDARTLSGHLARIEVIRIPFDKFTDGRGFSLARQFREMGFTGHLRASGHIVSDQFAFALQSGFDQVEIDDAMAERQPENYWQEAASVKYGYRDKLAQRQSV